MSKVWAIDILRQLVASLAVFVVAVMLTMTVMLTRRIARSPQRRQDDRGAHGRTFAIAVLFSAFILLDVAEHIERLGKPPTWRLWANLTVLSLTLIFLGQQIRIWRR